MPPLQIWLLGLILGLALALRVWGLAWSLPWPIHPDERTPVDQARAMLVSGDLGPEDFKNPSLFVYIVAGELVLTRALGPLAGLVAWDIPGSTHLLARLTSALIGTASVGILYAIGSTLFGRRVGVLAALFLAVSFIHVRNSHYAVNDVTAVGLLLLSLYCTARLLRQPTLRWYVLAGLVGGLATSTKYSMGFFFAPILVAHWLVMRETVPGTRDRWGVMAILLAGASGLAGYLIGTPYTLLDFEGFWSDFARQSSFANARWLGQPTDPVPWLYLTSLLQGFGAVPLALAACGLALSLRSRFSKTGQQTGQSRWSAETLVLLAFPVAYLAFLLPKAVFFPRLVLPLVPFCGLLAGVGAIEAVRHLGPRGRSTGLAVVLAVALVQPVVDDVRHNRLLLQTNTRVLATAWVRANLPPGSRVTAELRSIMEESTEGVPYPPGGPGLDIDNFDGSPDFDEADEYADRKVQYFVTSSHAYERLLRDPPLRSQRESGRRYQRLHRSLAKDARLIATFSPRADGREVPYSQDEIFTPFWNLDLYDRPGPTIHIYALDPLLAGPDPDR